MKNLSGGQKRRLQLLLILLSEPNVLILDEPTNDLDTDMLAAIEDLLDSWPGTLLVVSHDRYLVERVTDRQFAILDGHLRDLPRGVDQYLELRRQQSDAAGGAASTEASRPIAAGGAGLVAGQRARAAARSAGAGAGAAAAGATAPRHPRALRSPVPTVAPPRRSSHRSTAGSRSCRRRSRSSTRSSPGTTRATTWDSGSSATSSARWRHP